MELEQNVTLIRGDTGKYKINLVNQNNSQIILGDGDQLYFTMKESYENKDFVIQKYIGNGITLGDDNKYHLLLNSEDTDGLDFKNYVYDVAVVIGSEVKQKTTVKRGNFKIDYEVTHVGNEV